MSQKIFQNDLLAIRKSKVELKLDKRECVGIHILDMVTNQGYYSLILIVWCMKSNQRYL